MYKQIEDKVGEDIWEKWAYWHFLSDTDPAQARAYWKQEPGLGTYMDMKEALEPAVAQATIRVAAQLPEGQGAAIRDFEGELSRAAEAALSQIDNQMPEQNPSAELWEQALGPSLYRLLLDDEDLPDAAVQMLGNMGLEANLIRQTIR